MYLYSLGFGKHPTLAIISNHFLEGLNPWTFSFDKAVIKSLFNVIFTLCIAGSSCFLSGKREFTKCTEGDVCSLAGSVVPQIAEGASTAQGNHWYGAILGIVAAVIVVGVVVGGVSLALANPPAAAAVVGGVGTATQQLTPEQAQFIARMWGSLWVKSRDKVLYGIKKYCETLPPETENIRVGDISSFIENLFPELSFYNILLVLMEVFWGKGG